MLRFIIGAILGIIGFTILQAISFGITYAIVYAICWCFGIAMIPIAWVLGIWLILTLIRKA
jgi:hypothetical protein